MNERCLGKFFKNYQRGNAELAVYTYRQKYGNISQDALAQNIRTIDRVLLNSEIDSDRDRRLTSQINDFRIWFICTQWLCHGIFTDNTCVWFHRKYRDHDQALTILKNISEEYDCYLFGNPSKFKTKDFIIWPKEPTEEKLLTIRDKVNSKLHQWGHTPALLSDIRIWPSKEDLLNPGKQDFNDCLSSNCR